MRKSIESKLLLTSSLSSQISLGIVCSIAGPFVQAPYSLHNFTDKNSLINISAELLQAVAT